MQLMASSDPFGTRLRKVLQERGDSQYKAALRLGVTQGWIYRVLSGTRPSREFIRRVVATYGGDEGEWLESAGISAHRDPFEKVADEAAARVRETIREETRREVEKILAAQESPRDRYLRYLGRIAEVCSERQLSMPPPVYHGGVASLTRDQVDAAIRQFVQILSQDYPEHADAIRAAAQEVMDE